MKLLLRWIKFYILYVLPFIIFCLCIFAFSWRFLRERPLGAIDMPFDSISIFLYLISIIFALITLGQIVLSYFSTVKEPSGWVKNLLEKKQNFTQYYEDVLHNIYTRIISSIPKVNTLITAWVPKWFRLSFYFRILIYIFIYLFPVLVAVSFFVDIVINNEFYYFPKMIYILLFPICLRLSAWLCHEQCLLDIDFAETTIYMEDLEDGSKHYKVYDYVWEDSPQFAEHLAMNLNEIASAYLERKHFMKLSLSFYEFIKNLPYKRTFQFIGLIFWITSWITLILLMCEKL